MFQFQHIENLYTLFALLIFILLFFLLISWKKNAIKKIGDAGLVKQLIKGFSSKLFALKFILILIAFTLCAFAAADLVKPDGSQQIKRNGIDVMIALDVSKSMLAEDIKPSRLERAKQIVGKVIDKLSDDKIGIVIFAGRSYLQMPLTTDHSAAKMYLSSASPDDVPTQGTVISQALKMCYAAFNTKEKKYRSIILISDGEDHDDEAIKVTKELAQEGVMVNTIGIGSPQGAPIMDSQTNEYKKDENGNTVISKINEDELKEIAENGKGLYQLYSTADEVANNLYAQLASMGTSTLTDSTYTVYKNYFWYFLIAAFIFLLLENFISEKRNIRWLAGKNAFLIIFFLLFSAISFSQNVTKDIIKGNDAYKKQQYDKAADAYQNVIKWSPKNTTAYYNLGNALYKNNKLDDALQAYDNTVGTAHSKDDREKAYYNGGVVFQKQNKLPECIKAYKDALKIAPDDEEARQNLQRAMMQLKQQQKQEDQKNKKQDKKKDQDKKDEQKQKDEEKKDDQPKPQPSKISKQDAEEKLKSLLEHEKDLQDKFHKSRIASPDQPKKDW